MGPVSPVGRSDGASAQSSLGGPSWGKVWGKGNRDEKRAAFFLPRRRKIFNIPHRFNNRAPFSWAFLERVPHVGRKTPV